MKSRISHFLRVAALGLRALVTVFVIMAPIGKAQAAEPLKCESLFVPTMTGIHELIRGALSYTKTPFEGVFLVGMQRGDIKISRGEYSSQIIDLSQARLIRQTFPLERRSHNNLPELQSFATLYPEAIISLQFILRDRLEVVKVSGQVELYELSSAQWEQIRAYAAATAAAPTDVTAGDRK